MGRLKEAQAQNKEILVRIEQRFDRQDERFDRQDERNDQRFARNEERNDQQFREVNRRIDRLWYTIVGIGTAVIVGYVLQQVFGG